MSAKRDLHRALAGGDILEIVYSEKKEPVEEIQITYLPEPYDTEVRKGGQTMILKEYVDAHVKFVSGAHVNNEDNYDIMHDMKNGTVSFIHKNLGNFTLPKNMEGVGAVAKALGISNSASAAPNSSDSEYDSSGGARRRRRSTKSKKSKRSKRSTKRSTKAKKGKKVKKTHHTRRS